MVTMGSKTTISTNSISLWTTSLQIKIKCLKMNNCHQLYPFENYVKVKLDHFHHFLKFAEQTFAGDSLKGPRSILLARLSMFFQFPDTNCKSSPRLPLPLSGISTVPVALLKGLLNSS